MVSIREDKESRQEIWSEATQGVRGIRSPAPHESVEPYHTAYRRLLAAKAHWAVCLSLARVKKEDTEEHHRYSSVSQSAAATYSHTW